MEPQSVILEQVTHGIAVRMAVMSMALGSRSEQQETSCMKLSIIANGHALSTQPIIVDAKQQDLYIDQWPDHRHSASSPKALIADQTIDASGPHRVPRAH